MSRKVIELVQVLIDRIHQGGYTQRALEDDIYAESQKRIAAEKDRDHWKQARQEAHEAGELMQAEIETLRTQLADAKRAASDEFTERQVLTVEQQQDAAAWQQQLDAARAENETLRQQLADAEHPPAMAQQRDEIAYMRARLDEERSVSAGLRQQLDAARAAVTLQRAGIERLQAFVGKVRAILDREYDGREYEDIANALAELDAGSIQPTPVAEPAPCPECERLRAELETANEHRTDLVLFVDKVRKSFRVWGGDESFFHSVSHALDQLDAGTEPTPATEPLDAEGGA